MIWIIGHDIDDNDIDIKNIFCCDVDMQVCQILMVVLMILISDAIDDVILALKC